MKITQISLIAAVAAIIAFGAYGLVAPNHVNAAAALDETELAKEMEVVDESLRKLRRSIRKKEEALEDTLKLIDEAQIANIKCKALLPKMTESVPEAERAEFLKRYRLGMIEVMQKFTEMEVAVLKGEWDKAQECYDRLREIEEEQHKIFIPEEE